MTNDQWADERPTAAPIGRPRVFIDIESTGTNPHHDRIVEISCLREDPGGAEQQRTHRVNPVINIPASASKVHGIYDGDVDEEPPFAAYARSFNAFLDGCDLVGFNLINFDLVMLAAEFDRVGIPFDLEGRNIIDCMVIFHQQEPRTLEAAVMKYTGQSHDNAHSALADVKATRNIFKAQLEQYPELGTSMEDLHAVCHPTNPDWIDPEGKLTTTVAGPALTFGKHRGRTLEELSDIDPGYLSWILNSDFPAAVKDVVKGFVV